MEEEQDRQAQEVQSTAVSIGPIGKERVVYEGDFCVHEDFGFCKFLESFEENGENMILLEFKDGKITLPIDSRRVLTRHRSSDFKGVKLSSVAQQRTWIEKKRRVYRRVEAQALNVLEVHAKRAQKNRTPCPEDGEEMEAFGNAFPYNLTADQMKCGAEIEQDMVWRKQPMDRLLCGDVGFGKTEVALRAVYRAVLAGRQVAFLAPTTILAAQHTRTLKRRMPPEVNVQLLRATNSMESRSTKEGMVNGTVDVTVGTHTLLGRKVEFGNLGLLVIDEEQKFGVNQKERLKVITTGVDVLTLTATPIPRTLQLSLSGIRDLSTIATPPEGRQNVTTYVMKSEDDIIQRAIQRELRRGGQVFYVVPRIADLEKTEQRVRRLVPEAQVVVGHSQVKDLEERIVSFTLGKGNVLMATSIIENGIDMPNVNSIIIQDSFMFGLSQLYQMRGRVGRSNVPAFAYLLYPKDAKLSNDAKRRLNALRELSHLGCGFEIANRDLEIRGAGNMFGTDQSGDVGSIGYELYMNMLEKAIADAKGADVVSVFKCDIDLGDGGLDKGSVPDDYMSETQKTLELGRLRVAETYKELIEISEEWEEAFGPRPESVTAIFAHRALVTAGRRLGIERISLIPQKPGRKGGHAVRLDGKDVTGDRWFPLLDGALDFKLLARLEWDEELGAVVVDIGSDKSRWSRCLLEVLLPLVDYVDSKAACATTIDYKYRAAMPVE